MDTKKDYTELEVWTSGRALAKTIYSITKTFPKDEVFGLVNQMRRCATSIPSNIAEGCGRNSSKETIHFLYIARGSLFELETQTYISLDQEYIPIEVCDSIQKQILSCKRLIQGFIRYHESLISFPATDNRQPATN